MTSSNRNTDPFLSLRFRVEINALEVGAFSEVSGLQAEVEVHEYREGGVNDHMHRLAGPVKYPTNLTLKHGLMYVDTLWKWEQQMLAGKIERHNTSIILMNSAGEDKWLWEFKDACPVRWSGPDLRAASAEVAVETLELVHLGLMPTSGRI
jgi:phage tail-like protein